MPPARNLLPCLIIGLFVTASLAMGEEGKRLEFFETQIRLVNESFVR